MAVHNGFAILQIRCTISRCLSPSANVTLKFAHYHSIIGKDKGLAALVKAVINNELQIKFTSVLWNRADRLA